MVWIVTIEVLTGLGTQFEDIIKELLAIFYNFLWLMIQWRVKMTVNRMKTDTKQNNACWVGIL